jgi:hypothetical protein
MISIFHELSFLIKMIADHKYDLIPLNLLAHSRSLVPLRPFRYHTHQNDQTLIFKGCYAQAEMD